MKKQTIKFIFGLGLVILLSQHTAIAASHRDADDAKHGQNSPAPDQANYRQPESRYTAPNPYYKPNHAVKPLPRGYSRVTANATEYVYFDGMFHRPARQGYVAVNAPIGAVINHLPRFNTVTYSRGQPYFVVGNTFYRRHNNGYVVVPNPGKSYRH